MKILRVKQARRHLEVMPNPFNLKKIGMDWIIAEEELFEIPEVLDTQKHFPIYPDVNQKYIRKADKMERKAGRTYRIQTLIAKVSLIC